MGFSSVGKVKITVHVTILIVTIIVISLSTRVNRFQEFFFIADLFPFALSIVTLVLLSSAIVLDVATENSYSARPQFEIGLLGVLSIFWLAFNIFSTSRWRMVPFHCDTIPRDFADERAWCKDLQALKAFVWFEFVLCFATAIMTFQYSITQYNRGNKHIFRMPLSRYRPEFQSGAKSDFGCNSEFLQFEKLT